MSETLPRDETPVHDLIGVGFGPSNLALAIAVSEHNVTAPESPLSARFLERQESFGWHRGMLIDEATMQVSFLKDLVTLRNPASGFSFLSYLYDKGRLVDFVNHKTLFPLRVEFHDYFEWAARRVADMVDYGTEVTAVQPVLHDGEVEYFDVETSTGDVHRARNIVVATGLNPALPDGVAASDRVWHNSDLMHKVDGVRSASRFVVIGAGQSAAETTAMLHERFPDAEVCSVFSRFGYSPSDDSPFANRLFDPVSVDEFYAAPPEVKNRIMEYHANTNYSVVDPELIDELYRRSYREKVLGVRRLRILNVSRITDVSEKDEYVRVGVRSLTTGERTVLDADVLVCATGYRPGEVRALLGDAARYCLVDEHDRPQVERSYRLAMKPEVKAGVYVQGGGTEHTHGITSSLLSNNAVRSGEILDSILAGASPEKNRKANLDVSHLYEAGARAHATVGSAVGAGTDGGDRELRQFG